MFRGGFRVGRFGLGGVDLGTRGGFGDDGGGVGLRWLAREDRVGSRTMLVGLG